MAGGAAGPPTLARVEARGWEGGGGGEGVEEVRSAISACMCVSEQQNQTRTKTQEPLPRGQRGKHSDADTHFFGEAEKTANPRGHHWLNSHALRGRALYKSARQRQTGAGGPLEVKGEEQVVCAVAPLRKYHPDVLLLLLSLRLRLLSIVED